MMRGFLVSDEGKRFALEVRTAPPRTLSGSDVEDVGHPDVVSCASKAPEGPYTLDCLGMVAHGKRVMWKHGRVSMALGV